jgi:hypothetical protein
LLKTRHLSLTTILAVCLFGGSANADVFVPNIAVSSSGLIQFQFEGSCGDCPGDANGNASASIIQVPGTELISTGKGGYAVPATFTYESGWFGISNSEGILSFFSRSGSSNPADATSISFGGLGYVESRQGPGKDGYFNDLNSGYYSFSFWASQGRDWSLYLDDNLNDFGSNSNIVGSGGPPGPPSAVPEPSTWVMFGAGATALLLARRRTRNQ